MKSLLEVPFNAINMAHSKINIDTIPAELLLGILDYLPLQALHSLNLTNRHLYKCSLAHVYATSPGQNEQLLLRTITHPGNVELAKRVRNVICRLYTRPHLPRVSLEEGHAIFEAFQALPLSISNDRKTDLANTFWIKYLKAEPGTHEYFEFFLLFLPNVETLEVHDAWQWDDHTFWFTTISENASYFGRLKKATIHGPMRIENTVPLLKLPTLRNLELWQVIVTRRAVGELFDWEYPGQAMSERSSAGGNLETLALRESYFDTATLLPIFKAKRGLKSFTYEHKRNDLSSEEILDINYTALSCFFAHQAATIQHLDIRGGTFMRGHDWLELLSPECHRCSGQASAPVPIMNSLQSLSLAPIWLFDLINDAAGSDDLIASIRLLAGKLVLRLPSTLHMLHLGFRYMLEKPDDFTLLEMFLTFFAEALTARKSRELKTVSVASLDTDKELSGFEVQRLKMFFSISGADLVYKSCKSDGEEEVGPGE